MTKYFVNFWGDEAAFLLRQSKRCPGRATQVFEVETLRGLFEQLVLEGNRNSRACAAYLRPIILKTADGAEPNVPGESSLLSRFRQWRDFIEANYPRLHYLHELAVRLAVRPAYRCRVFKQLGQSSPFRYLTQPKMNRAADLLASAGLSVEATALELGYTDPYYFSRLFKSHFGYSPACFLEHYRRVRSGVDPCALGA